MKINSRRANDYLNFMNDQIIMKIKLIAIIVPSALEI